MCKNKKVIDICLIPVLKVCKKKQGLLQRNNINQIACLMFEKKSLKCINLHR